MPEGHTVHRAARLQNETLGGHALKVDSPQGRFQDGAEVLSGRVLLAIEAYGKHLFYEFEGPIYLHVHLGLFGRFAMGNGPVPVPRGAVRVRFAGGGNWVSLSGPTACEVVDRAQRRSIVSRIGPDPLRRNVRPAAMIDRVMQSKVSIGALLMDQRVIGGIGNVYRAEILYRAGLWPHRAGHTIERQALLDLWADARLLMRAGEKTGRIVTTAPRDRPHPLGAVRRGEQYYAYHRAALPCWVCGAAIRSGTIASRTAYWCPVCQPENGRRSSCRGA